MTAAVIFTSSGPIVIATSYESLQDARLIDLLAAKGIRKFVGFELPADLLRRRYGRHYDTVMGNLHETDELRVVDTDGDRIYGLFRFDEFGPVIFVEGEPEKAEV